MTATLDAAAYADHVAELTQAQLDAELLAAQQAMDIEALAAGPAALAAHLEPDLWVRRPHTDVIGDAVVDLALAAEDGRGERLAIFTPPQIGKSSIGVRWTTFWWLCVNPSHRVIIGCYSDGLAREHGEAIRGLVQKYGARFGLALDRSSRAKHGWRLVTGGGISAGGRSAATTGKRADLLVIDDPVKDQVEGDSPVHQARIWNWYTDVLQTRLTPVAPVILIQTRWAVEDLAGKALRQQGLREDGGLWRVVSMPALCTDPANDPLGRTQIGDPLPHPLLPVDDVEGLLALWQGRQRNTTIRTWSAMYQADPQPAEGALISAAVLEARRHHPPTAQPAKTAVSWDPSGGRRDDAGIVGGWLSDPETEPDGRARLYLCHDKTMIGPPDQQARAVCLLAYETGAGLIIYEETGVGMGGSQQLAVAWQALTDEGVIDTLLPKIRAVHARGSKADRAGPIAQAWAEDRIRTGAYLPDVEREWVTWQPSARWSPGRIDASVHMARELLPRLSLYTGPMMSTAAGISRDEVAAASRQPRIVRQAPQWPGWQPGHNRDGSYPLTQSPSHYNGGRRPYQ